MANKAFQKVYTQLEAITKATVSLKATGVSNDELALVDGRLAQVVKTKGDLVTLQVFSVQRVSLLMLRLYSSAAPRPST